MMWVWAAEVVVDDGFELGVDVEEMDNQGGEESTAKQRAAR